MTVVTTCISYFRDDWAFTRLMLKSNEQELVMKKACATPGTGIIVNTFPEHRGYFTINTGFGLRAKMKMKIW